MIRIDEFLDLLACPVCRGALAAASAPAVRLDCVTCGLEYPFHLEIPILLAPELRRPGEASPAELEHKERQVAFFDQDPADDFGVTRPRGAPALYGWLLEEKFRRSVLGLEGRLSGATALTICGGSGLDAEFLVRAGARVILSDISLGVVLQARERALRYGLEIALVVADAEALPFRDASIDLVYVHDGLHHLERPADGLAEMARVARRAVSVTEPAAAAVTNAAVRIGAAEAVEEAGNRVRRLTLAEIESDLSARGFQALRPHRYAMYYRHWPGRAVRLLSAPLLFPVAKTAFRAVNRAVGRFGNKLAVQAVRRSA
jgi:SAM-dependent methyltransferase